MRHDYDFGDLELMTRNSGSKLASRIMHDIKMLETDPLGPCFGESSLNEDSQFAHLRYLLST